MRKQQFVFRVLRSNTAFQITYCKIRFFWNWQILFG